MAWEENKNSIIGKVGAGTASAAEQAWYDSWVSAGRPETQAELQAAKSGNTGIDRQGGTATYWNPTVQKYQTDPFDSSTDYHAGGEGGFGFYENSQGDHVYGLIPENTYKRYDGDGYTTVAGIDPYPDAAAPPTLGMDDSGFQPLGGEGETRNPDGSINLPGGGNTLVPNPDIIRDNASGFNSGYTPQRIDWSAVDGGRAPLQVPSNVPLQGYESSSNKDFYQKQFADLRANQMRQQAENAALREQAAQPSQAPADPWAWTDLPETVVNEGGDDRSGFVLNSNYGFTPQSTNADILSALGPIWTSEEKELIPSWMESPGFNEMTGWARAGSPSNITSNLGDDLAQRNRDLFTKAANNLYTPAGDATTPGGFNVPAGYASPVNA